MKRAQTNMNASDIQNNLNNSNLTPGTVSNALDNITTNRNLQNDAYNIAHHLGTLYSVWDYRSWTENDKEAYEVLSKYRPIPMELQEAYFIITGGKKLRDDVNRLLDSEYRGRLLW
nr:hypothetical protein [uncultured Flavobacterium sp.]